MATELEKTVVESPQGKADITQVETPKGRAGVLAKFQKANPDYQGDPTDDDLWGFAGKDYDEVKEKYKDMSGANSRLADLVSRDARLGAVLSMVVGENPKSLPYAMGNVYGKDWLESDPEEFEKGYQENLARLAESKAEQEKAAKNIEQYQANLEQFKKDKGLDDAQIAELNDAIFTDAENFLMGNIPPEYIDYKWKGMNYDKDVEEAAVTGEVEGRNQTIEVKKKKITGETPLPDLANGTGAGRNRVIPTKGKKKSAYDGMEEITI